MLTPISRFWSLEELCRTSHGPNSLTQARIHGRIVAPEEVHANLRALALDVLDPLADVLGKGTVSSCYRCPAVNAAVGGAANSAHMEGLAADWLPAVPFAEAIHWLSAGSLPVAKVIFEERGATRWLHVQRRPVDAPAMPTGFLHSPRPGLYVAMLPDVLARRAT